MNWITTNIRLPEDTYMEFKMQAARQRKSVAEIMREKLINRDNKREKDAKSLLVELKKVARENAKYLKGKSLSKLLIEMRYEQ